MGSRGRRHAALVAVVLGAGCTVGAPPGFSGGSTWTMPLVGPLEDGVLIVPVVLNESGPFLFAIDPDAKLSVVDEQVVHDAELRTVGAAHFVDESDTQQARVIVEELHWKIGTLVFDAPTERRAMVVKAGTFDIDGRRVQGLIGRDILADSLVFGFDRDAGLAYLSTEKAFHAPAQARAVKYDLMSAKTNAEVPPLGRRLANAQVGGKSFKLHLDFGAVASQLDHDAWTDAQLAATDVDGAVIDEVGSVHAVKQQGVAATVTLGGASVSQVAFVPYGEKRWARFEVPGTLGLGFWKPFSVWANWDDSTIYLRDRHDAAATTKDRIGRWSALAGCAKVGCATLSLVDPLAGKPPDQMPAKHPGVIVSVVRDGSYRGPLEVFVRTSKPDGGVLPSLVASLPEGADRAMIHLPADYVGATLTLLDASPFPRACPGEGGCIDTLRAR